MGASSFTVINHQIKFNSHQDFIEQYIKMFDLPYIVRNNKENWIEVSETYKGIVFTLEEDELDNDETVINLEVEHYSGNSNCHVHRFYVCKDYICSYDFGYYSWGGYIDNFKEIVSYHTKYKEEHYHEFKLKHDKDLIKRFECLGSHTYILINSDLDDFIMEMVWNKMIFKNIVNYCKTNLYLYSFKNMSLLNKMDYEQKDFYYKFCLMDSIENNLHTF